MSALSFIIRQAGESDAPFLIECQLNMAMETERMQLDRETVTGGVYAVLADPARGFYLVAEAKGNPVACLMVTPEWSDWRNAWMWWLQSVYVLPDFRKSGVFGTMYAYVKEMIEQREDVGGLRLYVDRGNMPAQEVYRRVGMNGEHYITFEWMK